MIGQYLSNTNENATIYVLQFFLEVNKASKVKGEEEKFISMKLDKTSGRRPGTSLMSRPSGIATAKAGQR